MVQCFGASEPALPGKVVRRVARPLPHWATRCTAITASIASARRITDSRWLLGCCPHRPLGRCCTRSPWASPWLRCGSGAYGWRYRRSLSRPRRRRSSRAVHIRCTSTPTTAVTAADTTISPSDMWVAPSPPGSVLVAEQAWGSDTACAQGVRRSLHHPFGMPAQLGCMIACCCPWDKQILSVR